MRFIFSPTGTVTSEFGAIDEIRKNVPHRGVDFACPDGLPVHSLTNGVVSKITEEATSTLGNGVFIKTESGYQFIYGHFSKLNVLLSEHVNSGDVIGWCGSTGRSLGSHLHLGVLNKLGEYVDPQTVLQYVRAAFDTVVDVAAKL